jgi:heterodisulfide reductase subunit A
LQLKEKYQDITAFHLYRDIRTYGKQEVLYEQSSNQGDYYFKFEEKEAPVVEQHGKNLVLKFKDYLTAKMPLEIEADMVVLVTGMVARQDSVQISELFKIPIGSDKFFNEIHPKLKPVETVIKGVYIGGSCQGPKNISESVQSSLSASAKINALLKSGTVSVDPVIARVNADACTWCGKCAIVCDYTAIKEIESGTKHIAQVNTGLCTGCGICAPVCPVNAIEIAEYTDLEIESMIDGFMEEVEIKVRAVSTDSEVDANAVTMKEYPQVWKNILHTMKGTKKSIPQVAEELAIDKEVVTYNMMTMNKYSVVMAAGMDEKEEYFYYKIKNQ